MDAIMKTIVVVVQLAGFGLAFLAVFECGFKGQMWPKWWVENLNDDSTFAKVIEFLGFLILLMVLLPFCAIGGFGFILGRDRAVAIQCSRTGEEYLGQYDYWIERFELHIYARIQSDDAVSKIGINETLEHFMKFQKSPVPLFENGCSC